MQKYKIYSTHTFLGEVFNFSPKTSTSCANVLQIVKKFRVQLMYIATRAVTRTLIGGGGGVNIRKLVLCPKNLFSNQIQIHQFEKKSVRQNMGSISLLINPK